MTPDLFLESLRALNLPSVFNPYRDICSEHDHIDSAKIRCDNLKAYLSAFSQKGAHSVWVGRDFGYRGGRRTGIALTDEVHLPVLAFERGLVGVSQATAGKEMKERTATEVWKVLRDVEEQVFLWNVFPLHPFEEGEPMSNRRHSSKEFDACQHILVSLLQWLKPSKIIALGADAHNALTYLGFANDLVRHPSYGGQTEFARGIRRLYRI